ncbi:MAG: hypothetical protein ACOYJ1_12915 [Peptococcales bacterium]|jgi:hypothetical protein
MKKRVVIILNIILAITLISGGYGKWEKTLVIKEDITVIIPETENSEIHNFEIIEISEVGTNELTEKSNENDPDENDPDEAH